MSEIWKRGFVLLVHISPTLILISLFLLLFFFFFFFFFLLLLSPTTGLVVVVVAVLVLVTESIAKEFRSQAKEAEVPLAYA